MLAQERGAEQRHDQAIEQAEWSSALGFCDHDERATGFEDSQDLSHVGWLVYCASSYPAKKKLSSKRAVSSASDP